MKTPDDEAELLTPFRVLLDDQTVARLLELSDVCHAQPASVIAAIVRDVLEDDARAHMEEPPERLSLQ